MSRSMWSLVLCALASARPGQCGQKLTVGISVDHRSVAVE